MYTRYGYKRYPVTLTYTCTKNGRKRTGQIGVCARAEGSTRIDKYTRTRCTRIEQKGRGVNWQTHAHT